MSFDLVIVISAVLVGVMWPIGFSIYVAKLSPSGKKLSNLIIMFFACCGLMWSLTIVAELFNFIADYYLESCAQSEMHGNLNCSRTVMKLSDEVIEWSFLGALITSPLITMLVIKPRKYI